MKLRSFVFSFTAGLAGVALAVSGQPTLRAAAGLPATLTGETFTGTLSNVQGTCQSGRVSFDTTGVASGPYVGTYTADVTIESAPTPLTFPTELSFPPFTVRWDAGVRAVTTFSESFEIRAIDGTLLVTGTKVEVAPGSLYCTDEAILSLPGVTTAVPATERVSLETSLAYSAIIQTPIRDYRDRGVAIELGQFFAVPTVNYIFSGFAQSFLSLLTRPIGTPENADACKNEDWQELSRSDGSSFKNQGDCIQYVNTGK